MPPKRKSRLPPRADSTPSGDAVEHTEEVASSPEKAGKNAQPVAIQDAWTDEQETSLLKAIIQWKPVGMHKHFRMIAISQHLRNHGFTTDQDAHTRPPSIWKKLSTLYNLEALDEIEDTSTLGYRRDGQYSKEPFSDFELPDDEYADMQFARRLAPDGSSSPPSVPHQLSREGSLGRRRRQSTIDDTDDPRSSPASNRGGRGPRASRGTRTSQLAESSRPRSGRRTSKASVERSVEGDQKEEEGGDAMDVDEDEGRDLGKGAAGGRRSNTRRSGRRR